MRVLHVLPKLNRSGVAFYILDVINSCKLINSDIQLFVASQQGELDFKINEDKRITLPLASKNPFKILLNAWRLKKKARELKIDIIHAHSRAPAWSAYLACKILNIPFVTTYHGAYSQNKLKWFYNRIMVMGCRVVAVSQFIREHILFFYPSVKGKIQLIHQGIDIKKYTITSTDHLQIQKLRNDISGKIFFLPGRLSKNKGHLFLLSALIKLQKPLTFLINQPSNLNEENYLKVIEGSAKNSMVKIKKLTEDQKIGYHVADVVFVPSIKPEAFGRVVIEALACERPLLIADHGGIKDIISDPHFLFETQNQASLIKKLTALEDMDSVILKSKVNIQKNEVLDLFDQKKCAQKIISLYEQVMNEKNTHH